MRPTPWTPARQRAASLLLQRRRNRHFIFNLNFRTSSDALSGDGASAPLPLEWGQPQPCVAFLPDNGGPTRALCRTGGLRCSLRGRLLIVRIVRSTQRIAPASRAAIRIRQRISMAAAGPRCVFFRAQRSSHHRFDRVSTLLLNQFFYIRLPSAPGRLHHSQGTGRARVAAAHVASAGHLQRHRFSFTSFW